ncbi:helix-turn-helix transcriptional regulator [Lysobacter koreensis]|uniref:Helix-turn-helix transcriptional regulator n=1 Tax=Lysobacter koreensis TaxID=266122 RepID=A0ABW2YKV4_9GAMM
MGAERRLRLRQVVDRVGLHKTAIYARIAAGKFPVPVKDGSASFWLESEIEAYIAASKAARDGDQNGDERAAA